MQGVSSDQRICNNRAMKKTEGRRIERHDVLARGMCPIHNCRDNSCLCEVKNSRWGVRGVVQSWTQLSVQGSHSLMRVWCQQVYGLVAMLVEENGEHVTNVGDTNKRYVTRLLVWTLFHFHVDVQVDAYIC